MGAVDIESTQEAQQLAEAQAVLERLGGRLGGTEEELRRAKGELEELKEQLSDAEVGEREKDAVRIRREIVAIEERREQLEVQEAGLRKAVSQQHAVVMRLREPVKRMQLEAAVQDWLGLLPRLESWVAGPGVLIAGLADQAGFGPRLFNAATGRRLAVGPIAGDVALWRENTRALIAHLRKAGFRIPEDVS